MRSRYRGIATSAATAAAALLLQISLVATAPEMLLGTTMKTTSMAARPSSRGCNKTCGDHTMDMLSSYPFGFSPGCLIQLTCTPDGTASIGDFPVRNITSDTVTVTVSTMCDRPFRTIDPLFGKNFAPTSVNEIFLGNCTQPSPCLLPPSILTSQFPSPCNKSLGTTRCYHGKENGSVFLSYSEMSHMKCGILASSISVLQLGTNQPMQLEGQTIQLGWWVNGDECKCSKGANCTRVSPIPGGGNGYRCQCNMWFIGDGFMEGSGCLNGVLISVVAGICLSLCICCCIKGKCCPRRRNVDVLMACHGSGIPRRYKYRDLKRLTRSFSEKLGEGGYGKVYKGMLRDDGRLVAVKVLKDSKDSGEDFINEVASISKTAHVNVVELLGFCYEGKKRALLYDYMPNGSLDKFLPKSMDQGSPNCPLEWKVLHRIAVGIARGLEYLHQGCNTQILHFDIKPQNILLDEDFTPKISDFGLAKLCKGKDTFVSMLGTRGTIGYIAPEVFSRIFGVVSHKSDVYSYGMLVLELIGGKDRTSVEASRSSEMYFPDWIYKHLESGTPLWMSEINSPEDEEIVRKMMIVSLWCIQTHPIDRPPMSKVIEMLEGSFEQLGVPPKPHLSCPQGQASNVGSTTMSSSIQPSSALQNSKG